MIYAEPTKKGAGITIYGDAFDLRSIHETIHIIVDSSPLEEDQRHGILNLAYEIRHAYQGDREIIKVGYDEVEKCTYFGTKLIWPQLLFEIALLRQCAAYCENNKEYLSNLYRIEYCVEKALLEYDAKVGNEVITAYKRIRLISKEYLTDFVSDRSFDFLYGGGTGKMRFRRLPSILHSFDQLSEDYKQYHEFMWKEAKKHGTHPVNLHDMREWEEFEW
ncbi:MAG: hypothetical protein AB2810_20315 [Candidatus Thiodiazotropha endolucinida]